MRISSVLLLSLMHASLLVGEVLGIPFREPASPRIDRNGDDRQYYFLVSHVGFEYSPRQDWCITAKYGVRSRSRLGFAPCNFDAEPDNQLFFLDDQGKIHTKLDPSQCFVVGNGRKINPGHSRLRFRGCDQQVNFGTFTHNRGTGDLLRVKNDPSLCIKQNGPRPQATDALRAFPCDADSDDGFTFEYKEVDNPIPTATPGPPSRPPTPCNTDDFGTDCCTDGFCSTGFECSGPNKCVTPASYLVSVAGISDPDVLDFADALDLIDFDDVSCLYAKGEPGQELEEVVYQSCDATGISRQMWHMDTLGRIHSNLDMTRCLVANYGMNSAGVVELRLASCRFNHLFRYNEDIYQMRLGEDESYCLTGYDESPQRQLSGRPCKDAGLVVMVEF